MNAALRRISRRNLEQFKDWGIELRIPNQDILQDVRQPADLHGHGWHRIYFQIGCVVRIVLDWCISCWVFREIIVLPLPMRLSPMKVVWDFVNLEVASPVIGNAGSFTPSIDGISPLVCPLHDPQFHGRKIPVGEAFRFLRNQFQ